MPFKAATRSRAWQAGAEPPRSMSSIRVLDVYSPGKFATDSVMLAQPAPDRALRTQLLACPLADSSHPRARPSTTPCVAPLIEIHTSPGDPRFAASTI